MNKVRLWLQDRSNLGKCLMLVGGLFLVPLLLLAAYPNESHYAWTFLVPAGASIIVGLLACIFGLRTTQKIGWKRSRQRTSITILVIWVWACLCGALPFVLGNQLSFLRALFESISGWTTTGLSVMDTSSMPRVYMFFRGFMQYCGGAGFVLMMMLFTSGRPAVGLFEAEGHPDMVEPSLKKTAQSIFLLYVGCMLGGFLAFRMAGMRWFDALFHSMTAISTGGYSTQVNSIGEFQSVPITVITMVLMVIGMTNFAALILLAKGKIKRFFNLTETKFMVVLIVLWAIPLALSLMNTLHMSFGKAFYEAVFNVISTMSTAGYASMSYQHWPPLAIGVLMVTMLIGGGYGSTSGGLKIRRIYILTRCAWSNLISRSLPSHHVRSMYIMQAQGLTPIDYDLEDETTGYTAMYSLLFIVGSLAMSATTGNDLISCMFEYASCISNAGLSLGITNPFINTPTLLIEMTGMILGRLEIFIVLGGVTAIGAAMHDAVIRMHRNWERTHKKKLRS